MPVPDGEVEAQAVEIRRIQSMALPWALPSDRILKLRLQALNM